MPEFLQLREYSSVTLRATPDRVGALMAVAQNKVDILATGEPHVYSLRARQYVGTITVPGLQILIRPKVPLANVFTLLGVPDTSPSWQGDDFGYGTQRQLLPTLAELFEQATSGALGRGLLRAYRVEAERQPTLRGRIDFAAQARRSGMELPVACRFQEFTADVLENRALRAAIRSALRLGGVSENVRGKLRHQLVRLEGVTDEPVDAAAIDRIHFNRLNREYEPALRLAAVILRASTLVTTPGGAHASAFLIDMNNLFESYVADRLRRALRGRLDVRTQVPLPLDVDRKVMTKPDLVFERQERPVLVADTKYKVADDAKGRQADYYQLLGYTTLMNLPAGLLIYCHSGGGAPARRIVVRHGGQELWAIPISMAGTRQEMEMECVKLAARVMELAGGGRQDVAGRQTQLQLILLRPRL